MDVEIDSFIRSSRRLYDLGRYLRTDSAVTDDAIAPYIGPSPSFHIHIRMAFVAGHQRCCTLRGRHHYESAISRALINLDIRQLTS